MRHIVIRGQSGWITFFPHYLISCKIFGGKKILNIKYVLLFSLQLLSETFLILRKFQWAIVNLFRSSYKIPVILSTNNQYYALICTTPLFYIPGPTCFGSSLPSSGSFLDPFELLEIKIEQVAYHIMCGYVACVPDCRGSFDCASQLSALRPRNHTLYDIRSVFQVTQTDPRSSLMMADYCRNI
jgi:hypothetical protein